MPQAAGYDSIHLRTFVCFSFQPSKFRVHERASLPFLKTPRKFVKRQCVRKHPSVRQSAAGRNAAENTTPSVAMKIVSCTSSPARQAHERHAEVRSTYFLVRGEARVQARQTHSREMATMLNLWKKKGCQRKTGSTATWRKAEGVAPCQGRRQGDKCTLAAL